MKDLSNFDNRKSIVLVIDDEEFIRRSLHVFLEDNDFIILEAENGRVGLEVFEREMPSVILLDLRMPEVDGFEVLQRVKEISPDTPVIVVSGVGMLSDVIEALHLGAWDYIIKPIQDMNVLLHAVNRAMERVRLISENRAYQEQLEVQVAERTKDLINVNEQLKREIKEHKETEKALLISEKKFITTFRSSPNVISLVSIEDGFILDVNDNFLTQSGYRREEVIGNTFVGLGLCFREAYGKFLQTLVMIKSVRNLEITFACKSGRIAKGLMSAAIIDSGDELFFLATFNDISHLKQVESQLRQAQKMAAIGSLAGGIAHDFNNILSAIVGYSELALLEVNKETSINKYLHEVLKAGYRAKDLVRQILASSRQTEQEHKPLQPEIVIKEAIKLLRASLPATIQIYPSIKGNLNPA